MKAIKLFGWNTGMQVISVALALRDHAGLDLSAAKKVTDDILDGKERLVNIGSDDSAQTLLNVLVQLGVKAEIVRNAH